jgi:hypothetical protein
VEHLLSDCEFVTALNGLDWTPIDCGIVADFCTDDIAAFGKLVAFDLAVPPTILDIPGGYAIVFYKRDLARLADRGLRFPAHAKPEHATSFKCEGN